MIPLDTIIQGDCLEVMKEIPDKSIDLVLTDPPYGINKGKIAGDEDLMLFTFPLWEYPIFPQY
jgi:DNA modification methylase